MISQITLTDFRNHKMGRVLTHGRRNIIITGPNGGGKTAVLEAISMLSATRGLRGAPMSDIARFDGVGGFSVVAELADDTQIAVTYGAGDANRRARIDGDAATLSDVAARVRMVWITPREDRIFVDAASERRAFFDRLAASFDVAHAGRVSRLGKLLSERAFALKTGRDMRWVDALDDQIASTAVAVADARVKYAGEVNFFLDGYAVSVDGMLESMLVEKSAGDAERTYCEYLGGAREISGDKMVLDGPHKSDFGVFNHVLRLPAALTSTGQQKMALVELVMAHAKLIHAKSAHRPIILLDEAAAHLDTDARTRMFAAFAAAQTQVWATGIDINAFHDVDDATFVTCVNGEINNIL